MLYWRELPYMVQQRAKDFVDLSAAFEMICDRRGMSVDNNHEWSEAWHTLTTKRQRDILVKIRFEMRRAELAVSATLQREPVIIRL